MVTKALDALVSGLEADFTQANGGPRGAKIAERLGAYSREHVDWREFALFASDRYTRNGVVRTDAFELLILCWGPGQESPIHNHEGQDCWMAVLEGEVEELRYVTPAEVRPGPLDPRESRIFTPGQVAFIHDDIALHVVRGAHSRSAVSLHLYAAPYDACNTYCPETGRITRTELVNYSNRGELCAIR